MRKPRVHVFIERHLLDALRRLARREGASLSTQARDLLRDALAAREDLVLARIASEREQGLHRTKTLSHDAMWRRRAGPRRR